jgi:hypothetical protein
MTPAEAFDGPGFIVDRARGGLHGLEWNGNSPECAHVFRRFDEAKHDHAGHEKALAWIGAPAIYSQAALNEVARAATEDLGIHDSSGYA